MKAFGAALAASALTLVIVKLLRAASPTWWPILGAALLYLVLGLAVRLVNGPHKRG